MLMWRVVRQALDDWRTHRRQRAMLTQMTVRELADIGMTEVDRFVVLRRLSGRS